MGSHLFPLGNVEIDAHVQLGKPWRALLTQPHRRTRRWERPCRWPVIGAEHVGAETIQHPNPGEIAVAEFCGGSITNAANDIGGEVKVIHV